MNKRNEFYIRKNTVAKCYIAEEKGQLKNAYNSGLMNYAVGDWICVDPKDHTDSWVVVTNVHQNYTVLTKKQKSQEEELRKLIKNLRVIEKTIQKIT